MLATLIQSLSLHDEQLSSTHVTLLSIATTAVAIYTVSSVLDKKQRKLPEGVRLPPHCSSYIPYIGSGLKLVTGYTRDFIVNTAKKLKTPVFTANISGKKCVFIADPDLVFTVFKDSIQEIDSLSLQKQAMASITGMDPKLVEFYLLKDKERYKTSYDQIHKYLIQSDQLKKSIEAVQRVIGETLEAMGLSKANDDWKSFQMFEFVRKIIFFASIGPFISDGLIKDQFVEDYAKFEDGVSLLFSDAPSFITKENVAARERLIELLQTPEVDEGFSDFMKERKATLGDDPGAFARLNIGILIATVSNSIPSVFWILCHLLHTPEAFEACVEEVKRVASKKADKGDCFTLEELDEMKLLECCFKEALRMYQSFFATRNVTGDFILNPKEKSGPKFLIEKGTRIMAYPQTVHMDPKIFEDPGTFQFDRFLDPRKKALNGKLLSSYLKPFGGGVHLCPGRKFISYEARAFLAMLLLKLDMKFEDANQPIPDIQLHKQGFATANPKEDPTFLVKVRA